MCHDARAFFELGQYPEVMRSLGVPGVDTTCPLLVPTL
jgi:hypothetical protein